MGLVKMEQEISAVRQAEEEAEEEQTGVPQLRVLCLPLPMEGRAAMVALGLAVAQQGQAMAVMGPLLVQEAVAAERQQMVPVAMELMELTGTRHMAQAVAVAVAV
jgi:hypothetical protein